MSKQPMTTDTRPKKGKKRIKDSPQVFTFAPSPVMSICILANTPLDNLNDDALKELDNIEAWTRKVRGMVLAKRGIK